MYMETITTNRHAYCGQCHHDIMPGEPRTVIHTSGHYGGRICQSCIKAQVVTNPDKLITVPRPSHARL